MNWTASSRTLISSFLLLAGCAAAPRTAVDPEALSTGRKWVVEDGGSARVGFHHGVLDIDAPAGITLWYRSVLIGPIEIEFDATAVSAGGPNDQVSDLNVFWMATNPDGSAPMTPARSSGRFEAYNDMLTYYVGLGGNRNTTTRFRRYIGDPQVRPLLPEHDLSAPDTLLVPNRRQHITLIANGSHIEYRRDGRVLFAFEDSSPYTRGWFALRTTRSHLRIENLRIRQLAPSASR